MITKKSTIIMLVFAGLNFALSFQTISTKAIPRRDVLASSIASLIVFIISQSCIHRQVTLEKSAAFKKYFPILSISELITFLIVPWAVLISFRSSANWWALSYILSSHLYVVQTQVGLEPILTTQKRHGALFWFIAASNFYRGVAIATGAIRYIAIRDELLVSASSGRRIVTFLDLYTIVAVLVYTMANVLIVFLWHPLLKMGDDLTAGGLRTYNGSVCIITGGASGIGRELAMELGERGADAIILMDRQATLAEQIATELRSKDVESAVHDVDVRDFASVERIVRETRDKYGRLDYIFNNAGILIIGPIEEIGVKNFDYIFDVNVRGVNHGVQAAYPIMKDQGFGHIVNVSSLLGLLPGGQWAVAYSTSKHAVVGLSTNLRIEAAKYGVRVSCFCPGTIETPIHSGGKYGKNLTGIPKEVWDAQLAKMRAMDAASCASKALDDIAINKAILVVPNKTMLKSRLLYRLSPALWLHNKINKIGWSRKLNNSVAGAHENKTD